MSLQKAILKQYMELSGSPTLKIISEETGIQITRVFRLFNGSAMKLAEYEVFQDLVRKKLGFDIALEELVEECRGKLPMDDIRDIEAMIRRKLEFNALISLKKESFQTQQEMH